MAESGYTPTCSVLASALFPTCYVFSSKPHRSGVEKQGDATRFLPGDKLSLPNTVSILYPAGIFALLDICSKDLNKD